MSLKIAQRDSILKCYLEFKGEILTCKVEKQLE